MPAVWAVLDRPAGAELGGADPLGAGGRPRWSGCCSRSAPDRRAGPPQPRPSAGTIRIVTGAVFAMALVPIVPTPLPTRELAAAPAFVTSGAWRRVHGRRPQPGLLPLPARRLPTRCAGRRDRARTCRSPRATSSARTPPGRHGRCSARRAADHQRTSPRSRANRAEPPITRQLGWRRSRTCATGGPERSCCRRSGRTEALRGGDDRAAGLRAALDRRRVGLGRPPWPAEPAAVASSGRLMQQPGRAWAPAG